MGNPSAIPNISHSTSIYKFIGESVPYVNIHLKMTLTRLRNQLIRTCDFLPTLTPSINDYNTKN